MEAGPDVKNTPEQRAITITDHRCNVDELYS